MPCCNGVHMPLRRRQLAKAAGALLIFLGSASAAGAQASDPSGGAHLGVPATGAPQARLACSSSGGERQHCAADTSSGVIYAQYAPLFAQLTPEASAKVRKGNYERLFDQARQRVRAWERAHIKERS